MRKNARALRNTSTDAERHLWQRLRLKQLDGFRFRRQVPMAGYVADFVCPQARLIIELDGSQHLQRGNYDAARTSALEALGYRVLRYWNDGVLLRTDDVVADIHRQLTVAFTPPQPCPSLREREGANSKCNSNSSNSNSNSSNSNSSNSNSNSSNSNGNSSNSNGNSSNSGSDNSGDAEEAR